MYIHPLRREFLRVTIAATQFTSGRRRDDRGQSTAEYALLMLAAATIALLVVTWATRCKPMQFGHGLPSVLM